jgi:NAD(P)-dependent dehydrogenase (short-subunit alcohol dehydrogenase family)
MRFINKKVFITGASRGIGKAIAEAFRAEGAFIIGTCTGRAARVDSTCDEWIEADFSDVKQIEFCANAIRAKGPDILINNAGINKNAPFVKIDPDDFRAIYQVNVFAPFMLCQAAIPAMKIKGWGRIVNISSIWGKISMADRASYSASKFALDGMTLALALEHAADSIIANSIAPGFIDTDLTQSMLGDSGIKALVAKVPANRLGRDNEIARLTLWLSSDENTFIVGQNIAIDGGFTRA